MKDLIKSINNNSDDYGNKYLKIRLNSHGDIPFNRTLQFYKKIVRSPKG